MAGASAKAEGRANPCPGRPTPPQNTWGGVWNSSVGGPKRLGGGGGSRGRGRRCPGSRWRGCGTAGVTRGRGEGGRGTCVVGHLASSFEEGRKAAPRYSRTADRLALRKNPGYARTQPCRCLSGYRPMAIAMGRYHGGHRGGKRAFALWGSSGGSLRVRGLLGNDFLYVLACVPPRPPMLANF